MEYKAHSLVLFSGKTVRGYHERKEFEFTRYFAADGSLIAINDRKGERHGTWSVTSDGLCVDLGKGDRCRKIIKDGEKILKYTNQG